jgi:tetratricopeptide (TPR) repeat protein
MRFLPTVCLRAICAVALISTASLTAAPSMAAAKVPVVCERGWPVDASFWDNYRLYAKAVQAVEEGRHADAAHLYDCLNRLPDARLYHPAAIAHLRAGNLPAAEVNFRNELFFDPRSARAQMGLGVVYVQQGRRTEAEELLRTLEKRQKRCASACERAAEIDRATEVLARALG